jgi:hypothetical protein
MWVDPLELQDCSVDSAEEKGGETHTCMFALKKLLRED